ncbi:oxidoreductase [Trueperella sp. LYQ143]
MSQRRAKNETYAHLEQFAASRTGVEAYFEAQTSREPATVVFVATDGEWTRRKVPNLDQAVKLTNRLGIPLFDVARTGYPQSMRQWSARQQANRG